MNVWPNTRNERPGGEQPRIHVSCRSGCATLQVSIPVSTTASLAPSFAQLSRLLSFKADAAFCTQRFPAKGLAPDNGDNPALLTLMHGHPSFATLGILELLPRGCPDV